MNSRRRLRSIIQGEAAEQTYLEKAAAGQLPDSHKVNISNSSTYHFLIGEQLKLQGLPYIPVRQYNFLTGQQTVYFKGGNK